MPIRSFSVVSAPQAYLYSLCPPTQPPDLRAFAGCFCAGSRRLGVCPIARLVWCLLRRLFYTRSAHPPNRPKTPTKQPLRGRFSSGESGIHRFFEAVRLFVRCRLLLGAVRFAGFCGVLLRVAYARKCFCSRSPSLHGQTWLAIFNSLPYYGRGGRGARAKGGRPHPAPVDLPHPLLCGGLLWRALYTPKRGTQYGSVKPSYAPSRPCPPFRAERSASALHNGSPLRTRTALRFGRLAANSHGTCRRR